MSRVNTPNLDHWDPMAEDYEDHQFNSYAGRDFYENLPAFATQHQTSRMTSSGCEVYALHVKGVPLNMSEVGLRNLFMKYGDVRDVKLMSPIGLVNPKYLYGKVYYRTQQGAIHSLKALNETPPLYLKVELDRHSFGLDARPREVEWMTRFELHSYRGLNCVAGSGGLKGGEGLLPTPPLSFKMHTESSSRTVYAVDNRTVNSGTMVAPQGYARSRSSSQAKMLDTFCVKCQLRGTKCCTRCKTVYCSQACQRADWEQHRHVCLLQKVESELLPKQCLSSISHNSNSAQLSATPQSREETGSDAVRPVCPQATAPVQPKVLDKSDAQQQPAKSQLPGSQQKTIKFQPAGSQLQPPKFQSRPKFGKQDDVQPTKNGQQPTCKSGKQDDQRPAAKAKKEQQKPVAGPAGNGQKLRVDVRKQDNEPLANNSDPQSEQRGTNHQQLCRPKQPQTSESKAHQPSVPQKLCSMQPVTIGSSTKVNITHFSTPYDFYVQLNEAGNLRKIMRKVQVVSQNPPPETVDVGQIVAAKYSVDGIWYRAKVKKVSNDNLVVNFIDYGNDDFVTMHDLRYLSPDVAELPVQAVWCRLANIHPSNGTWSADAVSGIKIIIEEISQLQASLMKTCGGQAWVTLEEDSDDIGELFKTTGWATKRFCVHSSCIENWEIGTEIILSMPTVEWTGKIWASQTTGIPSEHLAAIFSELGSACADVEDVVDSEKFAVGAVVAAQSPTDQVWYRGMILKIYAHTFLVRYLDFGNCERVVNVCRLPASFYQYITLAICFRVDEPYATECIPDEFTPDDVLTVKILRMEGDSATVNVQFGEGSPTIQATACSVWNYDDGFEVFDTMLEETDLGVGHTESPCASDSCQATIPTKSPKIPTSSSIIGKGLDLLPKIEVPVIPTLVSPSWMESLDRLSVQILEAEKIDAVMKLTDELQEACEDEETSRPLTKLPAVGQLVCGQFSLDGMWNRALVENVYDDGKISIRFIDYGNTEVTSLDCLRPLPNSFYGICPMALTIAIEPVTSVSLEDLRLVLTPTGETPVSLLMTVTDGTVDPVRAVLTSFDGQSLEDLLADLTTIQKLEAEANSTEDLEAPEELEPIAAIGQSVDRARAAEEILSQDSAESTDLEYVVPSAVVFEVGQCLDLCIGDVFSPELIMVFKFDPDEIALYDKLAEDITKHCTTTAADGYQPKEGDFCLAKSAAFDQWFRALVSGAEDEKCTVVFPDYGNSEVVDISDTRMMIDAFRHTQFQAVSCGILGVETKKGGYSAEESAAFTTFIKNLTLIRAEVVEKEADYYTIRVSSIEPELKKMGFIAN